MARKAKQTAARVPGVPKQLPRDRHFREWPALVVIFLATFVAYFPALNGKMIWDDDAHVTKPELQSLEGLFRIWFNLGATQQYYPLLHSAFWIEHKLWGDHLLAYHLVNVLQHAAASCLVLFILRKLQIPGAPLAAAIFALHPVNVESVAWISEQKNTLSAVFYLSALWIYLKFDQTRRVSAYAGATSLFLLALLTKTVTATLPAALLVIFWWQRGKLSWRRDVLPLVPWFVLGTLAGLFTAWIERRLIGAEGTGFELTLAQRILLAGRTPWFYFVNLFWPTNLIFIYPRWNLSPAIGWQWLYPTATALTFVALWMLRSKTRAPLAGWLFFVGTLFPALGFFNVYPFIYSFVADHFQYLASLGIIVPMSAGIALVIHPLTPVARKVAVGSCVTLLGILACSTWRQSRVYGDVETLYQTTIARNPSCWMAYNNLGVNFSRQAQAQKAIECYQQALELKPDYAEAHFNLGNAFARAKDFEGAVVQYRHAIEARPSYAEAYNNLGMALLNLDHLDDATRAFQAAVNYQPDYAAAQVNLGTRLQAEGRQQEAIWHFEKSLQLTPGDFEVRGLLGSALLSAGRPQDAVGYLQQAVEAQPEKIEFQENTAIALAKLGQFPEAIQHFEQASRLDPSNIKALSNLITAYSQVNRPADAIATAQKALELARFSGQNDLAQQIEKWLTDYRTQTGQQQSKSATKSPSE